MNILKAIEEGVTRGLKKRKAAKQWKSASTAPSSVPSTTKADPKASPLATRMAAMSGKNPKKGGE